MKFPSSIRQDYKQPMASGRPAVRRHPLVRWGALAASLAALGVVLANSKEPEEIRAATENSSRAVAATSEPAFETVRIDLSTGEASPAEPLAVAPDEPAGPTPAAASGASPADKPTAESLGWRSPADHPPKPPATVATTATEPEPALRSETLTVEKGDTLAAIFSRMDLSATQLYHVVHAGKPAEALKHIRPGQQITFHFDGDDRLAGLSLDLDARRTLSIEGSGKSFTAQIDEHPLERRVAFAGGIIEDSLYNAGQAAGMPVDIIMEMANIFSWKVDFIRNVRQGDRFAVMYEELYKDGEKIGNGEILAAAFTNRGEEFRATRFEMADGRVDYFEPNGESLRRAFNRYPVDVVRISSRFNPNRMHPILKKRRPHNGTDFAARTGTPIKATGDGTISFRGWKGGYGRVIYIRHNEKYTTIYGHMSAFDKDFRQGSRVSRGDVIGYVGSTGHATGPHVHYEYRVNGVPRNSEKVELPQAASVPAGQMDAFNRISAKRLAQIDRFEAVKLAGKPAENPGG